MSFDDDAGIAVDFPFGHFIKLEDPVRQIAGAVAFVARLATFVITGQAWHQEEESA